jgi:signal peptidase I
MAVVIKTLLLQAFYIPSESMLPTLKVSDRVLVNKLSYHLHDVHRGDIVVFKRPPEEQAGPTQIKDLIKRVIGLPNETITLDNGRVLVDGKALREPYLASGAQTLPETVPLPIHLGPHSYLVLGDNRTNSRDGRTFGPIDRNLIVGRAFIRIWPVTNLGLL